MIAEEKVRAVIADGTGAARLADIIVAPPGPHEVQVQLEASGVCHTDMDAARTYRQPAVLGHEGAGTVTAVGSAVTRVAPGDRVLLTWSIACGSCFQCVRGNQVFCEVLGLGPTGHAGPSATVLDGVPLRRAFNLGTMSELTVVREEAVVPLPHGIPMTSACLFGCGVMTGFGSVVNAAQVPPGASVVVIGCGGVGLNVIQGARIAGAGRIVAVDKVPAKFELARRLGATDLVLVQDDDPKLVAAGAEVQRLVGLRGADFAFECTGIPALAAAPLAFVRHGGVAVQVSGVEQEIAIDMELFEFDKTYVNPLYGKCRPSVDFPILFDLYLRGLLHVDELVTRTYSLAEASNALEDLAAGRNARGVLVLR